MYGSGWRYATEEEWINRPDKNYFGSELRATQSGVVQNYLMGGIVGLVAIILIFQ